MTDKEILKRVEDRLDVAIGNYEITHEGWKSSGMDSAFHIITNIRNYIRDGKKLQKQLQMDSTTEHVHDQLVDEVFPTEHECE